VAKIGEVETVGKVGVLGLTRDRGEDEVLEEDAGLGGGQGS
jgi:hypothetical protein